MDREPVREHRKLISLLITKINVEEYYGNGLLDIQNVDWTVGIHKHCKCAGHAPLPLKRVPLVGLPHVHLFRSVSRGLSQLE